MAQIAAYSALNMSVNNNPQVTDLLDATTGELDFWHATGTYLEQYIGSFTFSGAAVPANLSGGTVSDLYFWSRGSTAEDLFLDLQITGLAANQATVQGFLDADNYKGLYQSLLSGADNIFGSPAGDILIGYGGNDIIKGKAGADVLWGYAGNDTLNGGGGIDTLYGGPGNDRFVVAQAGDRVIEAANAGTDRLDAKVDFTLPANVENMVLLKTASIKGIGNALNNEITGNPGNNVLAGRGGDDTLSGEGGNDILRGGGGKDTLFGGAGADVFDFNKAAHSPAGTGRDEIGDFDAQDLIDLSDIDANTGVEGDQAFTFISGTSFTGAGQVFYNSSTHILSANVDADTGADLEITILLSGISTITAADIVL